MRLRLKRYIIALSAAVLLVGCASWITGKPAPTPSGPGQISVSAYSQVDKAYIVLKRMALAKAADPSLPYTKEQLQAQLANADTARAALDAAQGSLAAGDLSTTIGKLQLAQGLLSSLSVFLAANPTP